MLLPMLYISLLFSIEETQQTGLNVLFFKIHHGIRHDIDDINQAVPLPGCCTRSDKSRPNRVHLNDIRFKTFTVIIIHNNTFSLAIGLAASSKFSSIVILPI